MAPVTIVSFIEEISMSLKLQSTLIKEDGQGNATVELMIADEAAATSGHDLCITSPSPTQVGSLWETVSLKVVVPANHNYLSGYQADAIKRAITILEGARTKLRKE